MDLEVLVCPSTERVMTMRYHVLNFRLRNASSVYSIIAQFVEKGFFPKVKPGIMNAFSDGM